MTRLRNRVLSLIAALALMLSLAPAALAGNNYEQLANEVADQLCNAVPDPTIGSTGGEWLVLGLSRSGYEAPAGYYDLYYKNLKQFAEDNDGKLSSRKYTEYARVVIALSAIGRDPSDVGGYDFLYYLADFNSVTSQGINGAATALIALDSGNWTLQESTDFKNTATREKYISYLLDDELPAGGFSLTGSGSPDADVTALVLQALAPYTDKSEVSAVIDRALLALSRIQNDDAGFGTLGLDETAESVSQVIIAMCALGIPQTDTRFEKNGATPLDALMRYSLGDGKFEHITDGGYDAMATEQALMALAAYNRFKSDESRLYDMSDVDFVDTEYDVSSQSRNPDVQAVAITDPDITFSDIANHKNRIAILALAQRGIITGMSGSLFAPDDTMTRAQFTAIVVRGLGLEPKSSSIFDDVSSDKWYAAYVDTAFSYELATGRTETAFDPEGLITRQEACVLVARAAVLCGFDNTMSDTEIRNMLAQFGDYRSADTWAQPAIAFCYKEGILSQSALNIEPRRYILRCEVAQMIYNMLSAAELI
ncbi:MAG: S-layer homology domain-containing protein [Oscillospiraceae bacterium]